MEKGDETLTPRRVTNVRLPLPIEAIILMGKEGPEMVCSRAGNCLHSGNSVLVEHGRIFPEQKHGGGSRKLRMA